MRRFGILSVVFFGILLSMAGNQSCDAEGVKLRVCVLTDISGDPDDQQSLVRFLTYANEFDVEGLIASTSCWKQNHPDAPAIHRVLDAYAQVQPNLLKHASGYPTADSLRHVTKTGVDGFSFSSIILIIIDNFILIIYIKCIWG